MIFIDGTAVNVALPVMQRELNATAAGLQWIIESYTLFLSALLLVGGVLGDRFGRRGIFVAGVALFTVSSLGCAVAPSLSVLIAARCLQGIGAALATPGSLALITAAYTGEERGRAIIGVWSAFSAITAALGPVLGGWLTQSWSWRAVFLINVPLGVAVLAIALLCVAESRDPAAPKSIDVAGASLATLGLGALIYGLIRLQTTHDAYAATACVAGLALLAFFLAYERKGTRNPMIRPDLFRVPAFTGANLYTFLLYAGLSGSLYFVPFDLINVQHYSPLEAGAALLPFIGIMFAGSRWAGGLVARIGARIPLTIGAVLAAIGFAAFALPGIAQSYWTSFFPPVVILGFAGMFFVAPLTTAVMDSAPSHEAGAASGVNNAVSRTAGLVAIAALGLALAAAFHTELERQLNSAHVTRVTSTIVENQEAVVLSGGAFVVPSTPEGNAAKRGIQIAYVAGFRVAMLLAAVLALCAALIAALWDWRLRDSPSYGT